MALNINEESQTKLHQFNSNELTLVGLGSNPNELDELIFDILKKSKELKTK